MTALRSDALSFFGATGDLAYKKIFPTLQSMVKEGRLDAPVVAGGTDPAHRGVLRVPGA